jgi:hypothetical protein
MTAPLLPPDVDLRGLDYMPLFGNHLFGSEFNAAASDSEWRAAITLWWAAWNQVPAGSLPGDDVALCRLADLGRDVKTWKRLRARALHGFIACTDGRLYHQFLCEQAMVAWDKRVKERERKAKWRADQDAKKRSKDGDVPGAATGTETGTSASGDATVRADGNGMDGNGRDDKERERERTDSETARASRLPPDWTLPDEWRAWAKTERPDLNPDAVADRFRDHWTAKPGKDGRKLDWQATWRNWVRGERQGPGVRTGSSEPEWVTERRSRIAEAAPYAVARPTTSNPPLFDDEVIDVDARPRIA